MMKGGTMPIVSASFTAPQSSAVGLVVAAIKAAAFALQNHHWNAPTHAVHVTVGELYDYLNEASDRIAEESIGLGVIPAVEQSTSDVGADFIALAPPETAAYLIDLLTVSGAQLPAALRATTEDVAGKIARHRYLILKAIGQ